MPYVLDNIDWSSKIAAARDAASKHTADALQIAAKKIGQFAENLQEAHENASSPQTLCQLVNGNGICQEYNLQKLFDAVGTTKATPYLIISTTGNQNGGKSTMLNYMFRTKFKQMDPNPTVFSQTTVGMWRSKSLKPRGTTVFVIDNEGCDGHERTETHEQDLERRHALMALRTSDIMLLNIHYANAGLVEGAK